MRKFPTFPARTGTQPHPLWLPFPSPTERLCILFWDPTLLPRTYPFAWAGTDTPHANTLHAHHLPPLPAHSHPHPLPQTGGTSSCLIVSFAFFPNSCYLPHHSCYEHSFKIVMSMHSPRHFRHFYTFSRRDIYYCGMPFSLHFTPCILFVCSNMHCVCLRVRHFVPSLLYLLPLHAYKCLVWPEWMWLCSPLATTGITCIKPTHSGLIPIIFSCCCSHLPSCPFPSPACLGGSWRDLRWRRRRGRDILCVCRLTFTMPPMPSHLFLLWSGILISMCIPSLHLCSPSYLYIMPVSVICLSQFYAVVILGGETNHPHLCLLMLPSLCLSSPSLFWRRKGGEEEGNLPLHMHACTHSLPAGGTGGAWRTHWRTNLHLAGRHS